MPKKRKKIGRPATGVTWTPLMLSLTPGRRETAEQIGPTAAKGVYALLDFARQNPALVAKVISHREASKNGKSTA